MALQTTTLTTIDQLIALTDEWQNLLSRSITNTTFQTPAFILPWLQTLGQKYQIRVITFRNGTNNLVGLALLYLNDNKQIEFIGGKDVSDYLDFIVDQDFQQEVYQQLSQVLISWQVPTIILHSIPAQSPTLQILPQNWAELTSKTVIQVLQDICPIISLPSTWEAYLAQIDRKQRHEIRRKWRKLESLAEVEFIEATDPGDVIWGVSEFIRLHKLSSRDKEKFWIPGMAEFFHDFMLALSEKNQLRLTFLKLKNLSIEPELDNPVNPFVSAMFGFISNNKYLLYNSGFDPDYAALSTGQVLTSYTIKKAIEEKLTVYDFMRGREEYKFRLGGQPTEVFDLTLSC